MLLPKLNELQRKKEKDEYRMIFHACLEVHVSIRERLPRGPSQRHLLSSWGMDKSLRNCMAQKHNADAFYCAEWTNYWPSVVLFVTYLSLRIRINDETSLIGWNKAWQRTKQFPAAFKLFSVSARWSLIMQEAWITIVLEYQNWSRSNQCARRFFLFSEFIVSQMGKSLGITLSKFQFHGSLALDIIHAKIPENLY